MQAVNGGGTVWRCVLALCGHSHQLLPDG